MRARVSETCEREEADNLRVRRRPLPHITATLNNRLLVHPGMLGILGYGAIWLPASAE